ncbi:microtubule-associated protein [Scheffersomyces amazonensis]|uniref:microtubule-associated protein n=1 Tax=Scheffersomyces amazonensis TaxID=1078765 RepID=UPI00315C4C40
MSTPSDSIQKTSSNGTTSSSTTNPLQGSKFDLDSIKDIIEEKKIAYLKGVTNTDVDWFLRDSSISTSSPKLLSNNSSQVELDKSKSNETFVSTKKLSSNSSISPVSSHLTAGISNTNDNNCNKTKPSIATIHEENVASSPTGSPQVVRKPKLSVSSVSNVSSSSNPISSSPTGSSSSGLFSKLKGKFHSHTPNSPPLTSSSPVNNASNPVFKSNYSMNTKKPSIPPQTQVPRSPPIDDLQHIKNNNNNNNNNNTSNIDNYKLTRTTSSPVNDSDPRLEEYIKFYQQKDIRRSSVSSRRSSTVSTGSAVSHNSSISHPTVSPLPSVLINYDDVQTPIASKLEPLETTISTVSSPPPASSLEMDPNFKDLKPLKRVAFHSSTFLIDPPQQIPSRNPRKGNVEVLPNGTVKINPLTEEDRIAMEKSQLGQGGGIVVGGTGALGLIKPIDKVSSNDNDNKGKDKVKDKDENEDDEEDEEVVIDTRDSNGEEDTAVDKHAKSLGIDKPMIPHTRRSYVVPVKKMALDLMYTRCCHLREILPIPAILKQIPKGSMAPLPVIQLRNPTPTNVEIQTFADFIRIAPIICVSLDGVSLSIEQLKILLSSMSAKKQLEKLSLRNTPIDSEGWALLCWFLSRNTVLNRLDITQCPALSVNVLKKRKKKVENKKYEEEIKRMTCNRDNRSDMDWSLFVATLVARGGIEELILTGCCITDLEVFEKLMKLAVSKNTNRLGLAYNQLTAKHFKIIVNNWLFQDFARGIDLGYNDFSSPSIQRIFLDYKRNTKNFDEIVSKSSLGFLSLNSTNIPFTEQFKEVFESILMKLPNLKYLDFSNNQRLFGTLSKQNQLEGSDSLDSDHNSTLNSNSNSNPDSPIDSPSPIKDLKLSEDAIAIYFTSKLPLFPKLIRLHLENNNFSSSSLTSIAKVIPFCKNLGYLSLLGNVIDLSSGSALINGLKNSKTLITLDCDIDNFPVIFKERIGLYTMRNMERLLYANKKSDISLNNNNSSTNSEGSNNNSETLAEQLNQILMAKAQSEIDLKSPEILKFIERAQNIRHELKETIDELLKLQLKNELDLDGKETLIRFIFIDSSIEKGLQLIDPSLVEPIKNNPQFFLSGAEDEKKLFKVSSEFNDDQHTVSTPQSNDIVHSASPLAMSRSTSRTNLNNLDRQEGSVLKLSKLHDFHHPTGGHSFDEMSGEEMRKKLKSIEFVDLDKIIGYLGKLKEQGISLERVFNQHGKPNFKTNTDREEFFSIEEIKNTGDNLNEAYDKVLSGIAAYKE